MIALWLDDERKMPEGFDVHIKTSREAIRLIEKGTVIFISFDHDLGESNNGDGYTVANNIERLAYLMAIPKIAWKIHSANPVGRERIRQAMESADRLFAKYT